MIWPLYDLIAVAKVTRDYTLLSPCLAMALPNFTEAKFAERDFVKLLKAFRPKLAYLYQTKIL